MVIKEGTKLQQLQKVGLWWLLRYFVLSWNHLLGWLLKEIKWRSQWRAFDEPIFLFMRRNQNWENVFWVDRKKIYAGIFFFHPVLFILVDMITEPAHWSEERMCFLRAGYQGKISEINIESPNIAGWSNRFRHLLETAIYLLQHWKQIERFCDWSTNTRPVSN